MSFIILKLQTLIQLKSSPRVLESRTKLASVLPHLHSSYLILDHQWLSSVTAGEGERWRKESSNFTNTVINLALGFFVLNRFQMLICSLRMLLWFLQRYLSPAVFSCAVPLMCVCQRLTFPPISILPCLLHSDGILIINWTHDLQAQRPHSPADSTLMMKTLLTTSFCLDM